MVVDTSALLAIVFREPGFEVFAEAIGSAQRCLMSTASHLEAATIVDRRGDANASRDFDRFLKLIGVEFSDVTFKQAKLARQAYRDFGKGVHPAALNYGDCFSYALAKSLDEPLLYKGNDFVRTDVISAL